MTTTTPTTTDNFPKSLYYVYVRLSRPAELPNLNAGRYLLTCASRYHADEFFRANQKRLGVGRVSPQMWTYTVGGEMGLHAVLKDASLPFKTKESIIMSWLQNGDIRIAWSVAAPLAGREWVSGQAYYVRNIRQPEAYWCLPGAEREVVSSRKRKTRFWVRAVDAAGEGPLYLVRSDHVRMVTQGAGGEEVVLRRGATAGMGAEVMCGVAAAGGAGVEFAFGDLMGGFGTGWADEVPDVELVTWAQRGGGLGGDDWELC
ncbi:uncharacterized protein H6S33_007053 [Morchella sextelata]|uniref:uncharacterized protein n=1 Tax=Morchella sextelata TaxID=1174677 RepID=UPI001D039905|nr:uncharacterized protein H6S33_007053 [Morchella sextelata]KAH0604022.1 hypothetical protein H6S33_007053 [Morchella sextelata]